MKDFKKLPKMACGGKVKKYEDGGKVYLGKAPDRGTIVRDNPKPDSDGKLYWTGSEPTAADKTRKLIGDAVVGAVDNLTAPFRSGSGLRQSTIQGMLNPPDRKKRGGKVTKKKK
jgi:hypothetical protein